MKVSPEYFACGCGHGAHYGGHGTQIKLDFDRCIDKNDNGWRSFSIRIGMFQAINIVRSKVTAKLIGICWHCGFNVIRCNTCDLETNGDVCGIF